MSYEQLKLDNQLCFPVYAASRLITSEYQPYLNELGITYPQYLVLMVLWEKGDSYVNDIARKLILNTNTITPLLKRMEHQGIIERKRSAKDERKVVVSLTAYGRSMEKKAAKIPELLANKLLSDKLDLHDIVSLKNKLEVLIEMLKK
ncbi:MAG: MarR family transcriptional regulator [Marinilabiliales bacterium]|nr:MAG: MarR family transcriptional regulator [Marinilabiliales bacterium]